MMFSLLGSLLKKIECELDTLLPHVEKKYLQVIKLLAYHDFSTLVKKKKYSLSWGYKKSHYSDFNSFGEINYNIQKEIFHNYQIYWLLI